MENRVWTRKANDDYQWWLLDNKWITNSFWWGWMIDRLYLSCQFGKQVLFRLIIC